MTYKTMIGFMLAALATVLPVRGNDWTKDYPLTGRPALNVDADDGSIHLISGNFDKIQARVTAEGWEIGKDVQITESQKGNSVEIRLRVPQIQWRFFDFGRRSLRIELIVPRDADLDLHTGDGSVDLQPVSGHIRVETLDGRITADGLKGDIRLHSGDGRIEASGLDGTLDAGTGDGSLVVRGRFDALQLKSGDGSIEAAIDSGSRVSGDWSIRTGDGSLRLSLPRDFSAELQAHTGDGRIHLDFPVTVSGTQSRTDVQGHIGSGGGPMVLRTGDGSIYLERR